MTDIVFLDTETTSLSAETGEVWEFAGIRRTPEGTETRLLLQIEVDLGTADPMSLKIGKFYERYGTSGLLANRYDAAELIAHFTRGAHIIGNVISFDAERLERLLRGHGQCPGWHYHIIDIEPMIVGHALANGLRFPLPYKSSDLCEWIGVDEPSEAERHTAMGDAEWVMRQWDALHALHIVPVIPEPSPGPFTFTTFTGLAQ